MRLCSALTERFDEQPVDRDLGPEHGDAVLVEGACEQFMWTGALERDVEFHDSVSDPRGPIVEQSIEWGNRGVIHADPGLG